MSDPIKARPRLDYYPAAHYGAVRSLNDLNLIILHSTEGSTAAGAAGWFHNPQSSASTHLVLDDDVAYRCVDDARVPWGAPGCNRYGLHIEHAGYAKWNWLQWMRHRKMLHRSAWHAAKWCVEYNIPAVWLSVDDLVRGKRGITSHANCSKAFKGSSHWDPGPRFPRWYWMRQVRAFVSELKGV